MVMKRVSRRGMRGLCALALAVVMAAGTAQPAAAGAHVWTAETEEAGPGVAREKKAEPEQELIPSEVLVTQEPQVIDELNGVQAICRPGGREDYDPVYNCTALVDNYYWDRYRIVILWWMPEPNVIPLTHQEVPFTVTETPEVGDIGFQRNDEGGQHWFLVKRVNEDGSITVIEQNYKWVEDGQTWCSVNRRVRFGETPGLKFFRRPSA